MDEGGKIIGQYRVMNTLGQGSYASVKLAQHIHTNEKVAIKIIDKGKIKNENHMDRLKREVRTLKVLHHPNIVKLYDVGETEKSIILTMELASGGELFDYIVAQGKLKEKEARRLFRQIVSAIGYCHQNFIVHRDLKPENLLLDEKRDIKITDFGLSNSYDPQSFLKTFCGSPYYASPEMVLGQEYVGPEVDIWSLGVILYALLSGNLPFYDKDQQKLYEKILKGEYQMPDYISPYGQDLIAGMIKVNKSLRISLQQVIHHPWINEGFEEIVNIYVPERQFPRNPDEETLSQMEIFGHHPQSTAIKLQNGISDSSTACYFLLLEKNYRKEKEKPVIAEPESRGGGDYRKNLIAAKLAKKGQVPTESRNRRTVAVVGAEELSNAKSRFLNSQIPNFTSPSPTPSPSQEQPSYPSSPVVLPPLPDIQQNMNGPIPRNVPEKIDPRRFHSLDPQYMEQLAKKAVESMGDQNAQSQTIDGLRVVGGLFNISTSSTMNPDRIREEVDRVLKENGINFKLDKYYFECQFLNPNNNSMVHFSIEICRIKNLTMFGILLNRIEGDTWLYKQIYDHLTSQFKI